MQQINPEIAQLAAQFATDLQTAFTSTNVPESLLADADRICGEAIAAISEAVCSDSPEPINELRAELTFL